MLLEEILTAILPAVGAAVIKSIDDRQTSELKDHLNSLNGKLSEGWRLRAMMNSFDKSESAIGALAQASTRFLDSVGIQPKSGIAALYQVRNFIIHQARNIPELSEEPLRQVIVEFAIFLPLVLATFDSQRGIGTE